LLIDEQFRKCVSYLFIEARHPESGVIEKIPVGTTFFVDVVDGPVKRAYAVTARHVVDESEEFGTLFMRLNTETSYIDIEVPQATWLLHESTDVAVARLRAPAGNYDILTLPHTNLLTDEGVGIAKIGIGDEVFFTGLFSEHPGRERAQPIIRFGNIAMMPHEPIKVTHLRVADRIDAYLVEARSTGGNSGSPAFVIFPAYRSGNSITVTAQLPVNMLGLVHGHHDIKQDIPLTGDNSGRARVPLNAGIASVVPSQKILDLLMSEELVQERLEARREIEVQGSLLNA
jgi:hypothetical protein